MELVLKHVSAGYGSRTNHTPVLKDISLTVTPGRRLVVMGENGSGKTTLLRVMAGILPFEGEVLLDGRPLSSYRRDELGLHIALLTQMSGSYYAFTVRETVMHGRFARRKQGTLFDTAARLSDREAVERVLNTTGLTEIADRPIDTLSGGQLQRVFLARAFVQETPLLLLDEPANHLDLKYRAELAEYLVRWSEEQEPDNGDGMHTLIGVFHDMTLAAGMAQDVLLLKEGRVLAFGEAKEILGDRALLKEAFSIDVAAYYADGMKSLTDT